MFDACVELTAEYSAIEERLADPAVHADPSEARRLARRHAELRPTIEAYRTWVALGDDMAAARELAEVDTELVGVHFETLVMLVGQDFGGSH